MTFRGLSLWCTCMPRLSIFAAARSSLLRHLRPRPGAGEVLGYRHHPRRDRPREGQARRDGHLQAHDRDQAGRVDLPAQAAIPGKTALTSSQAPPPADLIFVGNPIDPRRLGERAGRQATPSSSSQHSKAPVTWELKAVVSPKATPGKKSVVLDKNDTTLQACNKLGCVSSASTAATCRSPSSRCWTAIPMPVEEQFRPRSRRRSGPSRACRARPVPGPTADGTQIRSGPKPSRRARQAQGGQAGRAGRGRTQDGPREPRRDRRITDTTTNQGVGAFVLTAAIWGLISLVTPCVFPMIPITVSIFLKHAHGSFRERMKLAGGLLPHHHRRPRPLRVRAPEVHGDGCRSHPVTNVLLGLLFVVLALSLFGMYELTLPNFMVKRLQAKQAQGGVVGTIFGRWRSRSSASPAWRRSSAASRASRPPTPAAAA